MVHPPDVPAAPVPPPRGISLFSSLALRCCLVLESLFFLPLAGLLGPQLLLWYTVYSAVCGSVCYRAASLNGTAPQGLGLPLLGPLPLMFSLWSSVLSWKRAAPLLLATAAYVSYEWSRRRKCGNDPIFSLPLAAPSTPVPPLAPPPFTSFAKLCLAR